MSMTCCKAPNDYNVYGAVDVDIVVTAVVTAVVVRYVVR